MTFSGKRKAYAVERDGVSRVAEEINHEEEPGEGHGLVVVLQSGLPQIQLRLSTDRVRCFKNAERCIPVPRVRSQAYVEVQESYIVSHLFLSAARWGNKLTA